MEPILIKRYVNRKLYNTNTSGYVTLDDIAAMVNEGQDVRIVDHKTGNDITTVTLAQILFEQEKKQQVLPSHFLRDLVQSGGEKLSGFISKRLPINQLREGAEKRIEALEKLIPKGVFSREEGSELMGEILHSTQQSLEELQAAVDGKLKSLLEPMSTFSLMRKEIDALKSQIDLLEEKLKYLEETAGKNSKED